MIHLACSYPITSELHNICKPRKSIHFDPRTPRPHLALSVLTLVGVGAGIKFKDFIL